MSQLTNDIVFVAAGVTENGSMLDRCLDAGKNLRIGFAAGSQTGNTNGVRAVVEFRRAGDLLNGTISQILGGFGNDVEQQFDLLGERSDRHWCSTGQSRRRRHR